MGVPHRLFRASDIEVALRGIFTAAAAEQVTISAEGLNSDIHASSEYRAHLIGVLARRAVAEAVGK